jgi:dTDP-4-amino-4,6-dideoxygalactose transaminase
MFCHELKIINKRCTPATRIRGLKDRCAFWQVSQRECVHKHCEVGYNYRMSNVWLVMVGPKWKYVRQTCRFKKKRCMNFICYLFDNIKGILLHVPNADYFANYWLTTTFNRPNAHQRNNDETVRLKLL